jgi:hypothetical protein
MFGIAAVASVAADLPRAWAHSCAEPLVIAEGSETEVDVGVSVGDVPTEDVTFEFAPGFEVTDAPGLTGWEGEAADGAARFTGGRLDPQTCALFSVVVRADEPGTFRVRALQRLEGGEVVEHPPNGDLFAQPDGSVLQVNHAGPPNAAFEQVITVTAAGESSGAPIGLFAAMTAVGGVLWFAVSRRRNRRERARRR